MTELQSKEKPTKSGDKEGKGGKGSLAFRKNRDAIWDGQVPEKYTRLLTRVPGNRVLELGSAEGVLSLMLAPHKERVIALEVNKERHEEAKRLQEAWRNRGLDVDRCSMVLGNITQRLDMLAEVDTLLAVRSIYYLRSEIDRVFDAVAQHVENVTLCGNRHRTKKFHESGGDPDDSVGKYNYYATLEGMRSLLENRGFDITEVVTDGDPIVIAKKARAVT